MKSLLPLLAVSALVSVADADTVFRAGTDGSLVRADGSEVLPRKVVLAAD